MASYKETANATKSIIVDILKKTIIRRVVAKLPFLAFGPANFLLSQVVSWLAKEIAEDAEMMAFIARTDLRVDIQGRDYVKAVIRHLRAQSGTDEQEKKDAIEDLDHKFDCFVALRN